MLYFFPSDSLFRNADLKNFLKLVGTKMKYIQGCFKNLYLKKYVKFTIINLKYLTKIVSLQCGKMEVFSEIPHFYLTQYWRLVILTIYFWREEGEICHLSI